MFSKSKFKFLAPQDRVMRQALQGVVDFRQVGISFIYRLKTTGPSIDPWAIPHIPFI
jgi:hypothetical protein